MSDIDRGDGNRALNQRLAVITAILLSCLIVGFFAYLEGYQNEAGQNRSGEYAEIAKGNAVVRCQNDSPSVVADCVYEQMASSQEQVQNEQDLEAQKWMARSAIGMLILTALALYFIKATLSETARMAADTKKMADESRKATRAARKAANASAKATRAMINANRIARETATDQLRPYVFVQSTRVRFVRNSVPDGIKFTFVIHYQNFGQTPAFDVTANILICVARETVVITDDEMESGTPWILGSIAPNDPKRLNDIQITLSDDQLASIGSAKRSGETIRLVGIIKYGGGKYWTRFNYFVSGELLNEGVVMVCHQGNDAA